MHFLTQICGLALVLVLFVLLHSRRSLHLHREFLYITVLRVTLVSILLDIVSVFAIVHSDLFPEWVPELIAKLYVITLSWSGYTACIYMLEDVVSPKTYTRVAIGMAAFNVLVSVAALLLPISIVYDGAYVLYTEGAATLVVYASAAIHGVLIIVTCTAERKIMNPRKRFSLISWISLLLLAALIQLFFKRFLIISFTMALGATILFILQENPEANLDRKLGCFNSYAKSLYLARLYARKAPFAVLELRLDPELFTGKTEAEADRFQQELGNRFRDTKHLQLFKNPGLSFLLVSEDPAKLKDTAQDILWWMDTTKATSDNCTLIYCDDPYAFDSGYELDNFLVFLRSEGLLHAGKINEAGERELRMYRARRLMLSGAGSTEDYDAEQKFLQKHNARRRNLEIVDMLASEYLAVYHVDGDTGKLTPCFLNRERIAAFGKLFDGDLSYDEGYARLCGSVVYEEDKARMLTDCALPVVRSVLEDRDTYSVTFRCPRGDELRYYELRFVKLEGNDFIFGMADRDAEIRTIRRQEEAIRTAREETANAVREKDEFLHNVAHSLRLPVNSVNGYAKMALRDIEDREKLQEHLQKITAAEETVMSFVNDLLDLSRLQTGKIDLNEERGDITKVFSVLESQMKPRAARKNIDLSFKVDRITNERVYVDSVRLNRLLQNLVDNAIKFTQPGGWIRVNCFQLLDNDGKRGSYCFTIEDNGMGMSEEFQPHMFEQFAREDDSGTDFSRGAGLGLPLVKAILDRMEGTVSVVSTKGIGTKITLVIPLRLQSAGDRGPGQREQTVDASSFVGKRILVAEDNEMNREIAQDLLEEAGFVVETAENGAEAVDLVRKNPEDYYDYVLMDIQMPVMDGLEATAAIRKHVTGRHIPIVALSANAFEEDRRRSLESGMDDHIPKPIEIRRLLKALSRF